MEFARHHDRARYELHFASLSTVGPPAEDIRRAGAALHVLPDRQGSKVAQLRVVTKFLRTVRPDVLHTHNAYAHLYGSVSARLAGIKTVVHTRHGLALTGGAHEAQLFRLSCFLSDAVVCVSDDVRALSVAQGCSTTKCHRIWNGVDTTVFHSAERQSASTLISVGRLEAVKDFPTLLRAVALARAEHPHVEVVLVGAGRERASLESMARELGLTGCARFLGERNDVADLLRTSAVLVNSSRSEGVALALLEAMASGIPVIATSVGGSTEVVQDGVTGFLVPPGNPSALATAISKAIADPARLAEMGRAARVRVTEHFDIRRMVADYERLYAQARA